MQKNIKILSLIIFHLLLSGNCSNAQVEKFKVREGNVDVEVWRITNNPTIRDWANYHNKNCWSPDGRYLAYTHFASNGKEFGDAEVAEIHLFDFLENKDVFIAKGIRPRFAKKHNWIFYRSITSNNTGKVMFYDIEKGSTIFLADDIASLAEVDYKDKWLYAFKLDIDKNKNSKKAYETKIAVRILIDKNSKVEILPNDNKKFGWYIFPNQNSPYVIARDSRFRDICYDKSYPNKMPFVGRHFFVMDLDGKNKSISVPIMEGSHYSPDGAGNYFIAGNGPTRGFKFDASFPGNLNFLSNICVGDVGINGRSGRWICGSTGGGNGPLQVADLRSGEGRTIMKPLSVLCYPGNMDNSGEYDNDSKGSPDGTKVTFVSTYDLKDGPVTEISKSYDKDKLEVKSTEGFPENGRLVIVNGFRREVLSYESKTPTSFIGLKRGLYKTPSDGKLEIGMVVSSFEYRIIPKEMRENLPLPSKSIQKIVVDMNSPLRYQRSSDLYTVVVRKPDPPYLQKNGNDFELIPGENHWETYGYILFRNGKKITENLYKPGENIIVKELGNYQAISVENSGLEGKKSYPITIEAGSKIKILREKPSNFSWIHNRYLVAGDSVSEKTAFSVGEAVKEVIHLYDGVISKEWLSKGIISKKYDLSLEGKPIRLQFYKNGKLNKREYRDKYYNLISTEWFDGKGDIIKSVHIDCVGSEVNNEWEYKNGLPIKCSKKQGVYKVIKKDDESEFERWEKVNK